MVYLIDFENVHEEGFSALGRLGDKDAVYCFFTRNVAKISMSALAGMRSGQLHFIEAESGKQSLDLALVSFLGYLIGTRPQELYYDIVSNDNGFAKVAEFWNKRGNGLRVRIRKTTEVKQKAEPAAPAEPAPVAAAPAEAKQENGRSGQSKTRSRQRSQRQRGARQEQQANAAAPAPATAAAHAEASAPAPAPAPAAPAAAPAPAAPEAEPVVEAAPIPVSAPAAEAKTGDAKAAEPAKPKAEAKPLDAATLAALDAAGINTAAAEFIQAQAEKYRADKNMKQLVYRAVVKKYGQKTGTQIYNSAKKLLLK